MLGRGNTKPFWVHPTQGYHQWHILRWLAQAAQALAGLPGAAHYDKYQSDTIEEGQEVPGAFTQRPSSAHRRRDCMACHGTTWTAGDACRDRDKSLWGHPTQWYQNWYTLHCSSFNRLGSRCLCCLGQPCAAVIPSLVPLRRPERSQGASAEHATNGLRHIAVYSLP